MKAVEKKRKGILTLTKDKPGQNPMEGKKVVFIPDKEDPENADGAKGHLEAIGEIRYNPGFYERYTKRWMDIVFSFLGIVALSPIYLLLFIAIKVDDPGPAVFTQKRVGKNKRFFMLHKFRSMKMSTPHDVPTHMLQNPEQYITRVGRFMRRHSMDELPQCWDILVGNLSIIGPRPALWNQDLLTAEREKYGANNIRPGLTGWAQINGRDKIAIPDKARLDGQYCNMLKKGGFTAFAFDCRCFFGTVFSVLRGEGVVEGGTGSMHSSPINPNDGSMM